jgi:hypothetical protein
MFTFESYRDVLSESAHRRHIIGSAWAVLAVLGVVVLLFA